MSDARRFAVPFDPGYFAGRAQAGEPVPAIEAFRLAYSANHWAGEESRSGPGASRAQTEQLRRLIPEVCHRYGVLTLLDLPCGDGHWMTETDLGAIRYLGGDLLPEVVEANVRRAPPGRTFQVLDLTASPLPEADLLLCRDCLVHLSFADIARAIANIRVATVTYLLTTTFPGQRANEDIRTGDWRPLNLEAAPFGWPAPLEYLVEKCTEGNGLFADKSLGLWRVDSLPR